MINLYFVGIFLSLLNHDGQHVSDATRCFECQNVPFPRDCTKVIECGADEYCSTEQVVTAGGNVLFNSGCLHSSRCSSSGVSLIGKRSAYLLNTKRSTDVTLCIECCKDDFCNRNGCGTTEIPITQRGPYCFNCDAVVDAKACSNVTVCGKNEMCMLHSPIKYNGLPQTIYRGQCETQSVCATVLNAFSNNTCAPLCCNTDFCNDHCGSTSNITMTTTHPQTTLQVTQSSVKPTHKTQTQLPVVDLSTKSVFTTQGATDRTTRTAHIDCNSNGHYIHLQNEKAELCVHIVPYHANWVDARAACLREGGHLVVLDTHEKSLLLRSKLAEFDHAGFWIGLHDNYGLGHFTWVNHQPVKDSKMDWAYDQPDHTQYGLHQNCVMMLSSSNYQWHDTSCHLDHFNFICERQ